MVSAGNVIQRKLRMPRNSLQSRLMAFMALWTFLSLAILSTLGHLATRQTVDRSLQEREVLARTTGAHLEAVLQESLRYLVEFGGQGLDLKDGDQRPEREALRSLFFQSIFDDRVFLLDPEGRVLISEPQPGPSDPGEAAESGNEPLQSVLADRLLVSPVRYEEPGHRPVVTATAPLRDRDGRTVGWVGGSIDLTGPGLARIIAPARPGETGYVEVVDATGTVLASTRSELLLGESDHGETLAGLISRRESAVRTCHTCHQDAGTTLRETELMAFVPLETIPWGVGVRQAEAEALSPVRSLRQRFLIFGGLLLLLNVVMAFGISRGIVMPVRALTRSARRLAAGDLQDPIPPQSGDEVGALGTTLETMRQQLLESLTTIQEWNRVLEARIVERTSRLEEAQADRERLLERLISAQEEERLRVARELHDEVSQNIASLCLSLDRTAEEDSTLSDAARAERLTGLKTLGIRTLEEIRRMILDLRPSMLDDLGLVAALRWYAGNRLKAEGVRVHWDLPPEEQRLAPTLEVALFRIAQEAISNIARHAGAGNAIISLEYLRDAVEMTLEDDGQGFDLSGVLGPHRREAALGILGMQERVAILNGTVTLHSHVGGGTSVSVRVPLSQEEQDA